jgi:hypothetical protein
MKTSLRSVRAPLCVWGLAFVLPLFSLLSLSAQSGGPYSLNWSTIDGGGGTSSGGPYSLSGTIGQPDAGGPMTAGPYSLIGGFWSVVSTVQTPGAPLLTVRRDIVTGAVTLSWPQPADGFLLDQTPALQPIPPAIAWTQVAFPYQTNGGQISVTIPSPTNNRFYRLRRP